MPVRETLVEWRYEGGTAHWAASIIAQTAVEGGLAALLGYVALLGFEYAIGLDVLYLFTPAEARLAAWFVLSGIIGHQWTVGKFIPEN